VRLPGLLDSPPEAAAHACEKHCDPDHLKFRAFSSEVDTGSREENAINKDLETFSDSMASENALVAQRTVFRAETR
jgi:hypothetical protein